VTTLRRLVPALLLMSPALVRAQTTGKTRPPIAHRDTATVVVSHPTVIAYLVVPAGAVDSSADLAVLADDWNVAMATLGDSLLAHGVRLALVTEPMLRVRTAGRRDTVLVLDVGLAAGYVFARPGISACLRRGAAEIDDVLRAVRARAGCGARAR